MEDQVPGQTEKAERFALSLYPRHIRTIQQFARATRRSDSNAAQFIIEDWERLQRACLGQARSEGSACGAGA